MCRYGKMLAAVWVAAFAPLAGAQVQLELASGFATYSRVLQLPAGGQVLVGSGLAAESIGLFPAQMPHWQIGIWGVSLPVGTVLGGSGNDIVQDAAVDSAGDIWIVGKTDSDDFHLMNPLFGQKTPYRTAGFVIELNPTGTKVLFATYLAGQEGSSFNLYPPLCATYASAIVTDSAGNAYVGGSTDEADFLASPAVNLSGTSCSDSFGDTAYYSFLVKISPAGSWSTASG